MTKELKHRILNEQVHLAMEQLPATQGASLIVALILCYVVHDDVPDANILIWVTLVLLSVIGMVLQVGERGERGLTKPSSYYC